MMVLRGCSPETARAFAQRVGERQERTDGVNVYQGFFDILPGQRGQQVQLSAMPVLRPREIMYPPDACGQFCGLMHVTSVSAEPFLINLTQPREP
jgi:hypothetical protein